MKLAQVDQVQQHAAAFAAFGKDERREDGGKRQHTEMIEEQNSQAGFRFTISRCIHDLKPYRKI